MKNTIFRIIALISLVSIILSFSACAIRETDKDNNQTNEESTTNELDTTAVEEIVFPEATEGLVYSLNLDKKGYSLYGLGKCNNYKQIVIPEEYEGLPVTEIEGTTFSGSSVETVYIPKSIKIIQSCAFRTASYLEKVVIQAEIKTISDNAFEQCVKLRSINIPNGVKSIGRYAFASCKDLTSIEIPASVSYISEAAFISCKALKKVAFSKDSKTLTLESKVWEGCSYLKNIEFTMNIKTLPENLFSQSGLNAITFPKGLTKICERAFENTYFKLIEIPEGVLEIEYLAFANCNYLESMSLPSTLEIVEGHITEGSEILENISIDKNNKYFATDVNALVRLSDKCLIIGCSNTIIPDYTEIIGYVAFSGKHLITEINMPNSVKIIDESAFVNCVNLKSVNISKDSQLETIVPGAFGNCKSIEYIYLPKTVKSIGYSFSHCAKLENVEFGGTSNEFIVATGGDAFAPFRDSYYPNELKMKITCTDTVLSTGY